jgi:hypothetical protein
MSVIYDMGKTLPLSLAYFDQYGNPMKTKPTLDAAPHWSNTTSATEAITGADDETGMAKAVAVGDDTICVSLSVGGVPFTAALDVTVDGPPVVVAPPQSKGQVLTFIQIVPGDPVDEAPKPADAAHKGPVPVTTPAPMKVPEATKTDEARPPTPTVERNG